MSSLYGLILAGGKSTRMGKDKGLLDYHGVPQREYLYQLADTHCERTFYGIRSEQHHAFDDATQTIVDLDEYRGPLNSILSAHKAHKEVAWLVLACDLPLLTGKEVAQLVAARSTNGTATAFATKKSGLPEPLVAIWEPKGLREAMAYMKTAKSSCPRKFLIHSDTKLVFPTQDEALYNANSLEEYEFAKSKTQ
ncbi:Molybdopterin-guanine dinucleotide biosynthesis protein MobA [Croceitalea dokdonensis DOKDO 023]|uniref:Probable molybdenum cofactor guanylyltransferase n=1 Tax=Croceitalea dokdonensis DOKDO 023 TaxID=1300341 RepID=A0A0P7AIP2_9FLAO|nr:NTP transferase domain-containing protein [Croceitalea dokdonensis]KPM33458.1 Molybdopterin-guanine dinucleotide biosynthesis protein MobA [Croceitalea dokdonensis DOKDO 023]